MARRKPKAKHDPRKTQVRETYDKVLIVTEGEKTEQYYFDGLVRKLNLSTVNIKVLDIKQITPDSLFKKVKELYEDSKKQGDPFDKIYCVFDKDKHPKYQDTKNAIDQIEKPKNLYHYAFSEPCFEYWLLLHFQYTEKPFYDCNDLQKSKKFKKCFPKYQKNDKGIFEKLQDKITKACKNAKKSRHTNVNELVEYLQNIKNQ